METLRFCLLDMAQIGSMITKSSWSGMLATELQKQQWLEPSHANRRTTDRLIRL